MKNKENEKYLKIGITGAGIAAFAILFYFLMARTNGLSGVAGLLSGILRPFMYGAVIAYVVAPLARRLSRLFRGKANGVANVLALLIVLLLVTAVLLLIIPQLVNSLVGIVQAAPAQYEALKVRFWELLDRFSEAYPQHAETARNLVDKATAAIDNFLKTNFGTAEAAISKLMPYASDAAAQVGSAFGVLKDLLLGLIVALYLLAKREQLAAQATLIVRGAFKPAQAQWLEREARFTDRMFNGFFMGKLLDSAIIGVLCFIGCLLMGFKSSLLISVIVGVTNIIPFFGPLIGAIPCLLLLVLENPMHALMFLIFVIVLQQLDGNVIGPKILGDSTGLSALWVMFGILLFGGLWGLSGMLVGVPLTAILYDVIRQLTYRGLRRNGEEALLDGYRARFHPPLRRKEKKAVKKRK